MPKPGDPDYEELEDDLDSDPDGNAADDADNTPAVALADVSELVKSFKDMASKMSAPVAAPAEDTAAKKEKALADYNAAREEANRLASEGDTAGAMEKMYQAFTAVQTATSTPPENAPSTKAMIAAAKRGSRADHKDLYDRYGSEIETAMASRPLEDRINPDIWDSVAQDVRGRHVDDILADARKKWEDEEEAREKPASRGFDTPVARGARGAKRSADTIDPASLDDDQLMAARALGLDPTRYAKAVAAYKRAESKRGVVDLLDEPLKIQPGRF